MNLRHLQSNSCRSAGCTLTGALSVTTQIHDAITVVHGPSGCTHHNFSLLHATHLDNDRITLPPLVSTGLSETDVVFGGEGALERTLDSVIARNPAAVFVLSTCIVETIGDDVDMVCQGRNEVPVIVVPTAGFLGGSFQEGVNNALIALGGMAAPVKGNGEVNVIGEKNLEYEVEENFSEVSRLLDMLGLEVNIRFVHDLTAGQIAGLGAARLNVLRDPTLVPVGEYLRERFGTPFVSTYPAGISGTLAFLEAVGKICGIDCKEAIDEERSFRQDILDDFADLAGAGISLARHSPDPEGSRAAQDLAQALRLDVTSSGCPVPVPVTPPVGISGVRRLLHRWRRALHA